MAYLVIEINSDLSIGDLNSKCQSATKAREAVEGCRNLLDAVLAGAVDATVKVVSKDAATTINTSGTGSESETYDLK
jgi:hypothetical protein